MRILIADDDPVINRSLQELLEDLGHGVISTQNGKEALDVYKAGDPPRLAILDWVMPEMTGIEVIRKIRSEFQGDQPYIIMFAAKNEKEDIAQSIEAGANDYIAKPLDENELRLKLKIAIEFLNVRKQLRNLQNSVNSFAEAQQLAPLCSCCKKPRKDQSHHQALRQQIVLLQKSASRQMLCDQCLEESVDHNVATSPRPLRILIAEDSPMNQYLFSTLLEARGHTVILAKSGKEAVDHVAGDNFDIVLMDIHMPDMNGLEATKAIRLKEKGRGRHVRIVSLSASDVHSAFDNCISAGMDAHMSKTIEAEDFGPAVERFAQPAEVHKDGSISKAVFDREIFLARTKGKKALMKELVEIFLKQIPLLIFEIHTGVAQGNHEQITSAAHTLKGSCDHMGALAARDAAYRLEKIDLNETTDFIRMVLEDLEKELLILKNELTAINWEE